MRWTQQLESKRRYSLALPRGQRVFGLGSVAWTWRRESAAQFEQLAVRGGERGFEGGDLVAAAALLVGELGGELADDVPRCVAEGGRIADGRAAWLGAELLDAGAQRSSAVEEVRRAAGQARDRGM